MRDQANKDKMFGDLASDEIIGDKSDNPIPPAIGRTAGKANSSVVGTKPLGNTTEGQGKNFKADPLFDKKVGEKLTREELIRAAGGGDG